MADFIEAIKGFGGYTTTASLWLIAFVTWWRGLPGFMLAVEKIVDAIANRQSKVEERMNERLVEADKRFSETIASYEEMIAAERKRSAEERERHTECMEGQDALRTELDELRAQLDGFKRQWGQIGSSATRIEGKEVPKMIADAATRAATALASPEGTKDNENPD